uniref:Uncharacterized protein n=1 Tax=Oryzias melastigma TaxID=30732 RepID=A0A3B3BZD1_ORYME
APVWLRVGGLCTWRGVMMAKTAGTPLRNTSSTQTPGLVCLNFCLYAIGGYDGQSQLCTVECYNMARNVWEPRASMHHCRSAHGVTVHQDRIYVFGQFLAPLDMI